MGFSQAVDAQIFYVKIRPVAPVVARPVAPSAAHVWVEGDWIWETNRYVWHPGYWALPPKHGNVWVPGHWVHTRKGDYWVRGHWR